MPTPYRARGTRLCRRLRTRGFTLIELMISLVIASVLLSIAVGSYSSSIRKSRRTEAKSALLDLAGREERFFSTNGYYSAKWTDLGYSVAAAANGTALSVGTGYYTTSITVPTAAPTTFTLSAAPALADQLKDKKCLYFTVDQTGLQKSYDAGSTSGNDTTSTCWK